MKKILLLSLFVPLLFLATGCKTTSNPSGVVNGFDPAVVNKTVEIAAKLGTYTAIQHDTNSVVYFRIANACLGVAIISNDYTNIDSTINRITGNVLVTESIKDAIDLYQVFLGQVVTNKIQDQSPYIIPVLIGISDGIEAGIKMNGF